MGKYSKEVEDFIKGEILPKMGLKTLTDDNIWDVVEYMGKELEALVTKSKEAVLKLDDKQKEFLRLVNLAMAEITSKPGWAK